jgi:hypothetical protein
MLARTQKLNTYNMIISYQKHLEDIQCLMMANWYVTYVHVEILSLRNTVPYMAAKEIRLVVQHRAP